MSIWVNIGTITTGLILIIWVMNLIIRKKMTESQSVLWLAIGTSAIIIGIFPKIITFIANLLGIWYPPAIIFLVVYIGLLFIVLKNTVVISVQSNQIRELFMQVSMLNIENEQLKKKLNVNDEVVKSD